MDISPCACSGKDVNGACTQIVMSRETTPMTWPARHSLQTITTVNSPLVFGCDHWKRPVVAFSETRSPDGVLWSGGVNVFNAMHP